MFERLRAGGFETRRYRYAPTLARLSLSSREKREARVKGLYIYGDVGRGKTMLMDLFFEASPVVRKRRAHFHEFMIDVHERVHVLRQKMKLGEHADEDPIQLADVNRALKSSAMPKGVALGGVLNAQANAAWGKTFDDVVAHADAAVSADP